MIAEDIVNPHGLDPRSDLPHIPEAVENWTEYRYFFAYDAEAEIGLSLHIGRIVEDPAIWRGILYIFLPGQEILVRKCAGRDGDARSIGAGPLRLTCVDPMQLWTIDYDGLANAVPRASLSREPVRDGVDELVKLHIVLEAAAPLAILHPSTMKNLTWSKHHSEQIHSMRGEISYRGRTVALTGMGARDHSAGPRNSASAIGAFWANIRFPGGIVVNVNLARTKSFETRTGYVYWGDGTPMEEIEILACPAMNGPDTPDGSVPCDVMDETPTFEIEIGTSRGRRRIVAERLNTVASTYVPPHHEFGGTDLDRPEAAQMTKSAARFTMDGEVGCGQLDRFARIPTLARPR